jgi:hypothetical protein
MFRWSSGRALARLFEAAAARSVARPWRSALFRLHSTTALGGLESLAQVFNGPGRHLIDVRVAPIPLAAVRYDPALHTSQGIMATLQGIGLDVSEEIPSTSASLWSTQLLWSPGRN